MLLISTVKKFLLSYTMMENWAAWRVHQVNHTNLSTLLLNSQMQLSSFHQNLECELWGRFHAEFAWFVTLNLKNLRKRNQVMGVLLLAVWTYAASSNKTMSRFTGASKNRSSQGSAFSLGQESVEPTPKHKQKRKDESSLGHSNVSAKSSEGSARGTESNMPSEMPLEKSKKKKNVRIEV